MVQLTLTDEEAGRLKTALETYLSDLPMEIADSDAQDFREDLKHEESVITRLHRPVAGALSDAFTRAFKRTIQTCVSR